MKCVKAKGVPVVVYEPTLDAPEFFGSEVTHDLEAFKAGCDVIVANLGATSSRTWRTRCTRGICLSGTRGEQRPALGGRSHPLVIRPRERGVSANADTPRSSYFSPITITVTAGESSASPARKRGNYC